MFWAYTLLEEIVNFKTCALVISLIYGTLCAAGTIGFDMKRLHEIEAEKKTLTSNIHHLLDEKFIGVDKEFQNVLKTNTFGQCKFSGVSRYTYENEPYHLPMYSLVVTVLGKNHFVSWNPYIGTPNIRGYDPAPNSSCGAPSPLEGVTDVVDYDEANLKMIFASQLWENYDPRYDSFLDVVSTLDGSKIIDVVVHNPEFTLHCN